MSTTAGRKPSPLGGSNEFPLIVARALRSCMRKFNVSGEEVRSRLDVSPSLFYRLYNGTSNTTSGKYLDQIAAIFGLEVPVFMQNGTSKNKGRNRK